MSCIEVLIWWGYFSHQVFLTSLLCFIDDPPPYKDGVRINSPHYLCKLVENKKNATYTLVVSQYEKNNTIHYTLRVYATCDFSLTKIIDPYKKQYEKRVCKKIGNYIYHLLKRVYSTINISLFFWVCLLGIVTQFLVFKLEEKCAIRIVSLCIETPGYTKQA